MQALVFVTHIESEAEGVVHLYRAVSGSGRPQLPAHHRAGAGQAHHELVALWARVCGDAGAYAGSVLQPLLAQGCTLVVIIP